MKFIHTSDIHYGLVPDTGYPWSQERARDIHHALERIMDLCKENQAEALFISGNLFDTRPSFRQCEEVNELFASVPDTRILIIPGKCDPVDITSPVRTFEWADNVTYSMEPTAVYTSGSMRVLLACGDLPAAEEQEGYTYIAMGGKNGKDAAEDKRWAYPGSPEAIDPNEQGARGCYVVQTDEEHVTELQFTETSDIRYITLEVHLTTASTPEDILANLNYEMHRRGKQNIYTVRLKGLRDPSQDFNPESLQEEYRILLVSDESEPRYDLRGLFAEHNSDMIGFYINKLNKSGMSPVEKKALHYGIDALLRTSDERN